MRPLASRLSVDRPPTDPDNEAMYHQAALRVITWRRNHGMSQARFAKRARVSVGCLQSFEAATRATRKTQLIKIAQAVGLTIDQLLADDADAAQMPNPLLKDLLLEDLRIAQRFHHAGADTKHAVKTFLTAPMSEEHRERLAIMLANLIALDDALLAIVDAVLDPMTREGRSLAPSEAPALTVVVPPGKTNG